MNTPVEQAWFEFVRDNTSTVGLTVLFARERGPRPDKPFVTLNFIAGPDPLFDFDEVRRNVAREKFEIAGMRKYTVSIQAFGDCAVSILEELQIKLESPNVVSTFRQSDADIAVVGRGSITNVSELMETGYEERASMDVTFNSAKQIDVDVKTIEVVEYEGEIEDGKTLEISGTVETP